MVEVYVGSIVTYQKCRKALRFAYMDVGKGREQDAVSFSNLRVAATGKICNGSCAPPHSNLLPDRAKCYQADLLPFNPV
ncbi:MAG: hypothetical protein ACI9KN_002529 [Gammaproteobacteria bacterium]|jgi:hypothetical protein